MIFRYATYFPARRGLSDRDILEMLPSNIQKHLILSERRLGYVVVDRSNREIEREIDKIYGIANERRITKSLHAEVSLKEIGEFTHYHVGFQLLNYLRDFDAQIVSPTCASSVCIAGADLKGPFLFKSKRARNLGIAVLWAPSVYERYIMLSEKLKERFKAVGISGLRYKACNVGNKTAESSKVVVEVYGRGRQLMENAEVREWHCKSHRIPERFYCFDESKFQFELGKEDFQIIDTYTIRGNTYIFLFPTLLVSQRAVKLIMEENRRDLTIVTRFLKERFVPKAPWEDVMGAAAASEKSVREENDKEQGER